MEEYKKAWLYDPLLEPLLKNLRRSILELVKQGGYRSVLDVCCGTGSQLRYLQKAGIDATGIDLSEHMLKISGLGKTPVNCLMQDAASLDFEPGRFDLAMTTLALHEKPRELALKMIEEMIRVTRHEGHILLADFDFLNRPAFIARQVVTWIESMAAGDHYKHFRDYIEYGGLPELTRLLPLEEIHCRYHGMRSLAIRLYKKVDMGGKLS